jgi:hypothetical protein
MQEGIDKLCLLLMVCTITIVQREIASLGWGEAHSVECEYVARDSVEMTQRGSAYIGDEPRDGAPGPERGSR